MKNTLALFFTAAMITLPAFAQDKMTQDKMDKMDKMDSKKSTKKMKKTDKMDKMDKTTK